MKNYKLLKVIFLLGVFYLMSCGSEENECDDLVFRTSPVETLLLFNFNTQVNIDDIEILCDVNGLEDQDCKNLLQFSDNTYSFPITTNLNAITVKTPTKDYKIEFNYKFIQHQCYTQVVVERIVVNGEVLCEECNLQNTYTLN